MLPTEKTSERKKKEGAKITWVHCLGLTSQTHHLSSTGSSKRWWEGRLPWREGSLRLKEPVVSDRMKHNQGVKTNQPNRKQSKPKTKNQTSTKNQEAKPQRRTLVLRFWSLPLSCITLCHSHVHPILTTKKILPRFMVCFIMPWNWHLMSSIMLRHHLSGHGGEESGSWPSVISLGYVASSLVYLKLWGPLSALPVGACTQVFAGSNQSFGSSWSSPLWLIPNSLDPSFLPSTAWEKYTSTLYIENNCLHLILKIHTV